MRDKLQERLGTMEAENPSPSLNGKNQTLKEKAYFRVRNILGGLAVQKYKISDFVDDSDYQTSVVHYRNLRENDCIRWYNGTGNMNEKEQNYKEINYRNLRKFIFEIKKALDKGDIYSWAFRNQTIPQFLSELKEAGRKAGIEFNKEIYETFFREQVECQIKEAKIELDKYLVSSDYDIDLNGLSMRVDRIGHLSRLGDLHFNGRELIDASIKKYVDEAPTMPVSEALAKYGAYVVHAIPCDKSSRNSRLDWNNHGLRDYLEKPLDSLDLIDFVNIILEHRPMLSCSLVREDSSPKAFYKPVGVILKEGKIYTASSEDRGSLGLRGGARLPSKSSEGSLGERISSAIAFGESNLYNYGKYNEAIVGSYEIGGLYFIETNRKTRHDYNPVDVKEMANLALKKDLPLYRFRSREGFEQVNPQDYV